MVTTYRIYSISTRAYYSKTGSRKPEIRVEISRRAYGENKKAERKQCLRDFNRLCVLIE